MPRNATSLNRLGGYGIVLGALLLTVLVAVQYPLFHNEVKKAHASRVELSALQAVDAIEIWVTGESRALALLAKDPTLVTVLTEGGVKAIKARERALADLLPIARAVRLVPTGNVVEPLRERLAGLLRIKAQDARIAARVHRATVIDIDFAEPIYGISRAPLGHIVMSIPLGVLQDVLDSVRLVQGEGRLAVYDPDAPETPLVATGPMRTDAARERLAIPRTPWELAYWVTPTPTLAGFDQARYWVLYGAVLGLWALGIGLLVRYHARALGDDMVSMVSVVKDLSAGQPQDHYPARLNECRPALELLTRLAQDWPGARPRPRPNRTS